MLFSDQGTWAEDLSRELNPKQKKIYASKTKAPNWFTIRGLQLPKMVQTILDANKSIPQKSDLSTPDAKKASESGTEQFSYTPQGEKVASVFEQLRSGQIKIWISAVKIKSHAYNVPLLFWWWYNFLL